MEDNAVEKTACISVKKRTVARLVLFREAQSSTSDRPPLGTELGTEDVVTWPMPSATPPHTILSLGQRREVRSTIPIPEPQPRPAPRLLQHSLEEHRPRLLRVLAQKRSEVRPASPHLLLLHHRSSLECRPLRRATNIQCGKPSVQPPEPKQLPDSLVVRRPQLRAAARRQPHDERPHRRRRLQLCQAPPVRIRHAPPQRDRGLASVLHAQPSVHGGQQRGLRPRSALVRLGRAPRCVHHAARGPALQKGPNHGVELLVAAPLGHPLQGGIRCPQRVPHRAQPCQHSGVGRAAAGLGGAGGGDARQCPGAVGLDGDVDRVEPPLALGAAKGAADRHVLRLQLRRAHRVEQDAGRVVQDGRAVQRLGQPEERAAERRRQGHRRRPASRRSRRCGSAGRQRWVARGQLRGQGGAGAGRSAAAAAGVDVGRGQERQSTKGALALGLVDEDEDGRGPRPRRRLGSLVGRGVDVDLWEAVDGCSQVVAGRQVVGQGDEEGEGGRGVRCAVLCWEEICCTPDRVLLPLFPLPAGAPGAPPVSAARASATASADPPLEAALGRPNGPSFYMGTTQQTHTASSVMASALPGSGSGSASCGFSTHQLRTSARVASTATMEMSSPARPRGAATSSSYRSSKRQP
eukprot:scaffold36691_cov63-Phaeocystis_antarctica.AAC.2